MPIKDVNDQPQLRPDTGPKGFIDKTRAYLTDLASRRRINLGEREEAKKAGIGLNPTTSELAAAASLPMMVALGAEAPLVAAANMGISQLWDRVGGGVGRAVGEQVGPGVGDLGELAGTVLAQKGVSKTMSKLPGLGIPEAGLSSLRKAVAPVKKAGKTVKLYSGGDSGTFWTTNPQRAASYGSVRQVEVPEEVFRAGQKQAADLGQPTKWDTVLPNEWVKQAKSAPHIKQTVHEVEPVSAADMDSLLASLGIKQY